MSSAEAPPKVNRERSVSARDPRLRGWRDFLTAHDLLVRRLDDELQAETGLSLFEYSALLRLAEAPGRRMRMSELADGIILSRGGMTRLIDRLQADGLVERNRCLSDGRGTEAHLTEAGLSRLRDASKVHLRGIDAYYFEQVCDDDQATIGRVMRDISEGIRSRG
jgi:DNA-binding MarR family transcriptional regulator